MSGKFITEWEASGRITGRTSRPIAAAAHAGRLHIAYRGWNDNTIWHNSFDGSEWRGEEILVGQTSDAPAMASFDGRLCLAYKGRNNDTLWINTYDGERWEGERCIEGSPHSAPALATFGDELWVAYAKSDDTLAVKRFDRRTWSAETPVAGRTRRGPALASFGGSLYLAYKGFDNFTLWVNVHDGAGWESERKIAGQTSDSPALAAYRGFLFMAYKGWNNDTTWINSHRWIRWEGEAQLSPRTPVGPGLAVYKNILYLFFADSQQRIQHAALDGVSWEGERLISLNSNRSPALTVFRSRLFLACKEGRTNNIAVRSSQDGSRWRTEPVANLGGTTDSPALATHRVQYKPAASDPHFESRLFIAYRHTDSYLYASHFDGSVWRPEHALGVRSSHAPAMAPFANRLFAAYKGWADSYIQLTHHDSFLWEEIGGSWMEHSPSWTAERTVAGCQTDVSPALTAFRGELYLVYKEAGRTALWWKRGQWDRTDIAWEGAERLPMDSSDSPALAAYGDQLFLLCKGATDHDIYLNVYDKRLGWLGVYDVTTSGGLTNAALGAVCRSGVLFSVYKGWNDSRLFINNWRVPETWRPPRVPREVFDPDDPRDMSSRRVLTENGQPLNHYLETEHLQVFWNESEPDEAVSPSDARLVAETIETCWQVFTNPELAEGHPFEIDLNSPNFDRHPAKLSVRIQGVSTGNGGSSSPHLQISARGGVTGGASAPMWGPHGYAGGTAPHELGHVMNKGYSYHFNSGGSGLRWINEGIPDVYRAILDPDYPSNCPSPLIGHLDLSQRSLRVTDYEGRVFWYSLIRAYTRMHDRARIADPNWGFYDWSEIRWELHEMFRMVAGSAGLWKVRRVPGRDILLAIQNAFLQCYPLGHSTSECAAGAAPACAAGGSGCRPADGVLFRLMPLAMSRLDMALAPFWGTESPALRYRAFREFAERNFLAMSSPATEAQLSSGIADRGTYRIPPFGIHYHQRSLAAGREMTVTLTAASDLPNGEWAVRAFNFRAGALEPVSDWTDAGATVTVVFSGDSHPQPLVVVTGYDFGDSTPPTGQPAPNDAHYDLSVTVGRGSSAH